MKTRLVNYLKAGYPALFLVSHEELRMEYLLKAVADATERRLYAWSLTSGRLLIGSSEKADYDQISVLTQGIATMQDKSVLLLRDYHLHLNENDPIIIRALKDALVQAKERFITIVITGATLKLPVELEKLVTVIEFDLPDRATLRETLVQICTANERLVPEEETLEAILDAASGLTTTEAEDAFALSFVETDQIDPAVIQREKANTIKKNGILELIDSNISLAQIGGLENFKADLLAKRNLFTKSAREYGIPTPRGVLAVGQPGTGKSLTATATGSIFGIPLLRLEAGRLFGSLVGESESNWRNAFSTAKAITPCVLWIDEVDGLFSGSESSGRTDGGTTARVTKSILQDMQLNGEGIFFMFTANDIDSIPDPLIDRLDVWNVELPHAKEREAIWKIHIQKRARNPNDYDLRILAEASEGFSGRQIEQVWIQALTVAFNDDGREPQMSDILQVTKATVPTSKTMAVQIEGRRKRLEGRAKPASIPPELIKNEIVSKRKITQ